MIVEAYDGAAIKFGARDATSIDSTMKSQIKNLKPQLIAAIRDHVQKLPGKFVDGDFYGYALYTDEDTSSLGPVANAENDIGASADDVLYLPFRYSPDEWKYWKDFGTFKHVNQIIAALHAEPKKLFGKKIRDSILRVALDALKELEAEGFFGPRSARRFVVLWVSDSDSKVIGKSAKALNSPAVFKAFKELMGDELPDEYSSKKPTSLVEAARTFDNPTLRKLIAAGADVNAVDEEGWSPLMAAVTANAEGTLLLIQAGAAIDRRDRWGRTLLHRASNATTKILLDHGADVHAVDES